MVGIRAAFLVFSGLVLLATHVPSHAAEPAFKARAAGLASATLCSKAETVVTSFHILNSTKLVSVCEGPNQDYLVYRFGKHGNIELQYPESLDRSSWLQFEHFAYQKGEDFGGLGEAALKFDHWGTEYVIYQGWHPASGTADLFIGVTKPDGSKVAIKGDQATLLGGLQTLEFERGQDKAFDELRSLSDAAAADAEG